MGDLLFEVLCVLRFLSYGDNVPTVETLHRMDNVAQVCFLRIPVQENRLDFYGHRGLTTCRSIICVCIS